MLTKRGKDYKRKFFLIVITILVPLFLISGCNLIEFPQETGNVNSEAFEKEIPQDVDEIKSTKKEFDFNECIKDLTIETYSPGKIAIMFIQDVTIEQVNELLSSYNLSSNSIKFPEKMEYRIDFSGNIVGFENYLKKKGFTRRTPASYFLLSSSKDINCKEADEIFYSYSDVNISQTFCFSQASGLIQVPEGNEKYLVCELQKSSIVSSAELDVLISLH